MHNLAQTPFLVFTNILFIAFFYFYLRSTIKYGYISKAKKRITIFLIFVFCLMSFWGTDWFGYLSYYMAVKNGWAEHVPMEDVYVWLMEDVCTDYLQFRAIVWGTALFFFVMTIKRLKINVGIALFFFCCIYLIYFSYARATLAITMMTYGYTLIWSNNKRWNIHHTFLGLSIVACSFFFHKSAIFGIVAILFAIIIKKAGNTGVKISLLLYPLAVFGLMLFFRDYFSSFTEADDTLGEYAQAGASYLESEKGWMGIGTFIQRILERVPYYLLAYCSYRELKHPSMKHVSTMKACFTLLLLEIAMASLFLFDIGLSTSTVYTRFVRYAQIPACIVLTYLYQNRLQRRCVKYAYSIGLLGCAYSLIYTFYNQFF